MTRRRAGIVLAFLVAILGQSDPALAQRRRQNGPELPQPVLRSVYPQGMQRGRTIDVGIRGNEIDGTPSLWFDHPGLSADHVKDGIYRVHCDDQTPLGHHDVRISTRFGVSNPRTFVIGDRPETVESEPNDKPDQAALIAINSVRNGEIAAVADVDWLRFDGKKGQRLFLEIEAERIDSRLDPTLRVFDESGRELAESRDYEGADPFLDFTPTADRPYFIKVQDVTYAGSPDHGYRLTITDAPRIDAIQPALAHPGETRSHTLYGGNLGGEICGKSSDGRPIERKQVEITAPKRSDHRGTRSMAVRSSSAGRKGFEFALDSPSGRSNAVFLSWTDDPILAERDLSVDPGGVRRVGVPCAISGSFETQNESDLYRFNAKRGKRSGSRPRPRRSGRRSIPS